VVTQPLVPVGDHRSAPVPASTADDVHRVDGEGVRGAHDRADVGVVAEVLDRHM
jgi:hypothetical protein